MAKNRYYGFYRGTVMQQLSNGFCKVAIPGILYMTDDKGNIDVNKLPPAECAAESFGGTINNGTFKYPDLNSTVWCFFENGDVNKPIYFASAHSGLAGWKSSDVAVPGQEDIPGYALTPVIGVGKVSNFADSSISQTVTIDPNSGDNLNSTIKLSVNYTAAAAEAKAEVISDNKTANKLQGNPIGTAVSIILDNANNKLILTAANTIELLAPKIIINGTKLGELGSVDINTDNIKITATNDISMFNKSLNNKSTGIVDIANKTERILLTQ